MATSSIFSNVVIKDDKSCRALIAAIESSRESKIKETKIPNNIKVVDDVNEARLIFSKRK